MGTGGAYTCDNVQQNDIQGEEIPGEISAASAARAKKNYLQHGGNYYRSRLARAMFFSS